MNNCSLNKINSYLAADHSLRLTSLPGEKPGQLHQPTNRGSANIFALPAMQTESVVPQHQQDQIRVSSACRLGRMSIGMSVTGASIKDK